MRPATGWLVLICCQPGASLLCGCCVVEADGARRRMAGPVTEEWWSHVLADPRARAPTQRRDYTAKKRFIGSPRSRATGSTGALARCQLLQAVREECHLE